MHVIGAAQGMNAPALLKLLSNFTGLHTDAQIINQMRSANQCEVRPSSEESSEEPAVSPLAAAQHPHARRAARLRPPPPTSHHLPQARSAKKKPLSFTKRDDSNASQAARAALERVKPQVCTPRPAGRRAQSRPPTRALPPLPTPRFAPDGRSSMPSSRRTTSSSANSSTPTSTGATPRTPTHVGLVKCNS